MTYLPSPYPAYGILFLGHMSSFTNIQHVRSKADLDIDFISRSGYKKSIWKLNNDAYPDLPSDQICAYNIYVYIQIWKKKLDRAIPVVAWLALDQTCSSVLFLFSFWFNHAHLLF